jgi:type IX secretion system PorP/SprF family membrane protein
MRTARYLMTGKWTKLIAVFFTIMLSICTGAVRAQQNPVYSQYLFNGLVLNPAYAGNQEQLDIIALYRKQWDNFEGAPSTGTISANYRPEDSRIGIAVLAGFDQIGVHKNNRLSVNYAYKLPLGRGMLSMGLRAGFSFLQSDFSNLTLRADNDPLLNTSETDFNPNVGTGLYYSTNDLFIGISVPQLINNRIREDIVTDIPIAARQARNYFINAGKVFTLNEFFKLMPSVLVSVQEGNATTLDVNANVIFDDVLTAGVSYRSKDAIIFNFELKLNDNFNFGYAYDYTTSEIGRYASGSHEIMLNYNIPFSRRCHAYF